MRSPRSTLVLLFTILCLVLFVAPPRVALMQTDGEDWYIAEYAKMVGIPYEEAARRLAIQAEMSELQTRILEREPDHVASWLLHTPEFGLVVGFIVPNGEEILQKYLEGIEWAHLVKAQQVKYTLDELNAIHLQVMESARAADVPFNSGENIPEGKVTLYTPLPDVLRTRLEAMEAMQPYLADIEYVYVEALAAPAEPPESENPMIAPYAKDMGISYEEAERRLTLQNEMDDLESRIIDGEPNYAGSWMVHAPDFGLVVAFTVPNGEEIIQQYLEGIEWAHLVKVRQAKYSLDELDAIHLQVMEIARTADIPFNSGTNIPEGKVTLYTTTPDALRTQLETMELMRSYLADIEYVYVEALAAPAELKYPYLLGGHPIGCTTGYVVRRKDNSKRFITTAGHCENTLYVKYNGVASIYLGGVEFKSDPTSGVVAQRHLDMQTHMAEVRSFDLTNEVRINATQTAHVVSRELKATTLNDYVCKYGEATGLHCGWVINLDYVPYNQPEYHNNPSNRYVLVYNPIAISDLACPGDSGSPVFKYDDGAVAVGILSAHHTEDHCNDLPVARYFTYSPVDEIEAVGYSILTSHYQQHYYLIVWTGTGPSCTMYKRPVNDDGTLGPATTPPCPITAPGSGTVQS